MKEQKGFALRQNGAVWRRIWNRFMLYLRKPKNMV